MKPQLKESSFAPIFFFLMQACLGMARVEVYQIFFSKQDLFLMRNRIESREESDHKIYNGCKKWQL